MLEGERFAVTLARPIGKPLPKPGDHRSMLLAVHDSVDVLAGALPLALVRRNGAWRVRAPSA